MLRMASRGTSFVSHAAGLSTVPGGRRPGWGKLYPVVDNPVEYRPTLCGTPCQEGVARVRTRRARTGRHVGADRRRRAPLLQGLVASHQTHRHAQQHRDAGGLRRNHPRTHRDQAAYRDRDEAQRGDGNQDLPGLRDRPVAARRDPRPGDRPTLAPHRREGPAPSFRESQLRSETEPALHLRVVRRGFLEPPRPPWRNNPASRTTR